MKNGKLKPALDVILLFVIVMASYVVAVIALYLFGGMHLTGTPMQRIWKSCILSFMQNGIFSFMTIFVAVRLWKKKISDLGLTSLKQDWKDMIVGLLVGVAGITIPFLLMLISKSAEIESVSTQYIGVVAVSFLSYLFVGFGEEIFFRGGVMLGLKETKSKWIIIGVSSVIFGAMHLGNNGVTLLAICNLILFGIVAGYCFYRSRSIWFTIGMHITWNFFQGNIYGFPVSGGQDYSIITLCIPRENIFTGRTFGPEGGLGVTIALILMLILCKFYYRNQKENTFFTK